MTKNKEVVSWTINIEIVNIINKEAEEQNRSKSFIANKYLKEVLA